MAREVNKIIKSIVKKVKKTSHDVLILLGITVFIFAMFKYVSVLAGYISLSISLIIIGLLLSWIRTIDGKDY